MTDRKAQYRQSKAKERQAKREAGLVPVEVWVPKGWEDAVRDIAAEYRDCMIAPPLPKDTTTP